MIQVRLRSTKQRQQMASALRETCDHERSSPEYKYANPSDDDPPEEGLLEDVVVEERH